MVDDPSVQFHTEGGHLLTNALPAAQSQLSVRTRTNSPARHKLAFEVDDGRQVCLAVSAPVMNLSEVGRECFQRPRISTIYEVEAAGGLLQVVSTGEGLRFGI